MSAKGLILHILQSWHGFCLSEPWGRRGGANKGRSFEILKGSGGNHETIYKASDAKRC